jgi:serine phosphatase RsbU (regulator of sigma subunit)
MKERRYIFCFLLTWIFSCNGIAQLAKIDALKNELNSATQDTVKMMLELNLCIECNAAALYSDAINYGKQAVDLGEKLQSSATKSISTFAKKTEGRAAINVGNSYSNTGDYPNALIYYNKGLKIKEELGDKIGMAHAFNNIGLVYENQSDFATALDYFFKSLNISITVDDKHSMALAYNNIGVIYLNQQNFQQAITYYKKGMEIYKALDEKTGVADAYNNIAGIYDNDNKYLEALEYHQKSLAIRKEINYLDGVALSYNNIGNIYNQLITQPDSIKKRFISEYYSNSSTAPTLKDIDMVLMDSSLALQQKALEIGKRINNKYSIVYSLEVIGNVIKQRGQYANALYYYRQGAAIAKQINTRHEYYEQLASISECFEKMGKVDSAFFYYKRAADIKDTIFSSDKQKDIGREEAKADYEKKQAIAEAENKKRLAIDEEQRKRQQLIIYAGTAGILMLGFFSFFIAQRLRITRRQKSIIENQKGSLDKAFVQLEDAKLLLEEKHKDLTDSIHYASRIQTALLTTQKYLDDHLREYFILFKPRDIVSGDFYWALERNGTFYLACCDCTGHGVPGAFMSLLNITFLHQTVIEKGISQPDKIFNNIRTNVIEALNPDGTSDTKDGMDAVLCAINFENHILKAACANNPMWIIRNGEFIEFKADKIPIGDGDETRPFTLHEINLLKGDVVYMFTDGYADQFGGPNGKKYKLAQLKELVLSIHLKPMQEQHTILNTAFSDWKGALDQVDDVSVMGLRI